LGFVFLSSIITWAFGCRFISHIILLDNKPKTKNYNVIIEAHNFIIIFLFGFLFHLITHIFHCLFYRIQFFLVIFLQLNSIKSVFCINLIHLLHFILNQSLPPHSVWIIFTFGSNRSPSMPLHFLTFGHS